MARTVKRYALVGALSLGSLASLAGAQEFDWRRFEGTNIRFLMNNHPFTDFITPLVPEFEELTGINVTLESFPEDQFRQRRLLEASSGASSLDGYMIQPGQDGAQYLGAGWVRFVDDFVADSTLTNPELDMEDFFEGAISTFETEGGLYGLPLQIESSVLFYRTDLFEEAGLDGPPETMEELREYAEALNGPGMAGFAARGRGANATSQIVNFLYSFGGQWLNDDGTSALDSEASQEALAFYADLLRNYGPPGVVNMSWPEVTSIFAQNQAAMMFDANVFRSIIEDPAQTLDVVRENVAYAPLPEGPAGRVPAVLVWGLSVNHASQNPEASWYFIQWALSKENQLAALLEGVPAARPSAWENEEFQATAPESWIEASQLHYSIGHGDWNPPVVPVPEVRDAYGQAIVAALQGQEVGPALEQANREINAILERSNSAQ
ncbi:ABC transporter substrate-binding protein [Truepera radiovictrix]|uniref:Extracellular solute-binding protein family 1 n=1 Tax=Truepera radiovictrix (strain DSM 17093 / CIP 108686 / LMG 22925 / RQ-24) TaxID=649638 RepID=D7CRW6_TRURR|nr:sugar ABC transporter substrate-binding protein [Truepera radiovictrix]ADI15294.1 extracellular solute-binding protein family 1 [Truepera radiovictrix DSM 17093]WMT56155.1 sugar ABC transporter substrate-binding protein [Truepera radiovictrix]